MMGLPNRNDGKPMPALAGAGGGFIPKGAKNVAVAKDFMKFFMQPQVMNENLKQGLGRWVPVIPSDREERSVLARYQETRTGRPMCTKPCWGRPCPTYNGYNPAWGQVNAEQLWGVAHADVIKNGMTPAAAVDKAFKRAEAIFAKYTFG